MTDKDFQDFMAQQAGLSQQAVHARMTSPQQQPAPEQVSQRRLVQAVVLSRRLLTEHEAEDVRRQYAEESLS